MGKKGYVVVVVVVTSFEKQRYHLVVATTTGKVLPRTQFRLGERPEVSLTDGRFIELKRAVLSYGNKTPTVPPLYRSTSTTKLLKV